MVMSFYNAEVGADTRPRDVAVKAVMRWIRFAVKGSQLQLLDGSLLMLACIMFWMM